MAPAQFMGRTLVRQKTILDMDTAIRRLAGGIGLGINDMTGQNLDFLLIVAQPMHPGEVMLRTIGTIDDAVNIARIGQHLIDMARAKQEEAASDLINLETRGHA